MLDPESALISCTSPQEIVAACGDILDQLAPDVARQLRAVRNSYFLAYGWEGVFERFNGRTVAQVLAEYQEPPEPPVVARGEVGGVRYTLFNPPEEGRAEQGALEASRGDKRPKKLGSGRGRQRGGQMKRASDQDVIQALQERNADRECATDGGLHPRKPIPPASPRDLQQAERVLGFQLPELLRAIYLQVGNGGFGPEYGIVGTAGGFKLDKCSLESCYQRMLRLEKENSVWRWPERLLPLANYGCGMWACVDCEHKNLPMILWDPNNLDAELDGADARVNWASAFWDQGGALRNWLEGWLAGEPGPEPEPPTNSWMRRRLGFTLPK
jgi:hypothetical protein